MVPIAPETWKRARVVRLSEFALPTGRSLYSGFPLQTEWAPHISDTCWFAQSSAQSVRPCAQHVLRIESSLDMCPLRLCSRSSLDGLVRHSTRSLADGLSPGITACCPIARHITDLDIRLGTQSCACCPSLLAQVPSPLYGAG